MIRNKSEFFTILNFDCYGFFSEDWNPFLKPYNLKFIRMLEGDTFIVKGSKSSVISWWKANVEDENPFTTGSAKKVIT